MNWWYILIVSCNLWKSEANLKINLPLSMFEMILEYKPLLTGRRCWMLRLIWRNLVTSINLSQDLINVFVLPTGSLAFILFLQLYWQIAGLTHSQILQENSFPIVSFWTPSVRLHIYNSTGWYQLTALVPKLCQVM